MKVLRQIVHAVVTAIVDRNKPQVGSIDFETGKVVW